MMYVSDGILHMRKVDVPDIDVNITDDMHQSYQKYVSETVYKDMQYFQDLLSNLAPNFELRTRVGSLINVTYNKSQTRGGQMYYPVYGAFYSNGMQVTSEFEVIKIPYMNTDGKLNINGNDRVMMMIQRSSEDISYNVKRQRLNIAMPYANIRIDASTKSIKMLYGTKSYHMHDIIRAMMYAEGVDENLKDVFVNTYLLQCLDLRQFIQNEAVYSVLSQNTKTSVNAPSLLDRIYGEQYELGRTRNALNVALSLHRAVGYTLSRQVLSYPKGTLITNDVVIDLIRNRINKVFVRTYDIPKGYVFAAPTPMIIMKIPAGMKNGRYLRNRFPKYADYDNIPEDINLSIDEAIIFGRATQITEEIVEFLIDCDILQIDVKTPKSSTVMKFSFEREIIGNYTAKRSELTSDISGGTSADDWVYYYNNPNLEYRDDKNLNCHDMMAMVSVLGEILSTGKTTLLDRDTAFLKKILLPGDLFSETLRAVMPDFIKKYKVALSNICIGKKDPSSIFFVLTRKWYKQMNDQRLLATPDTINMSSEVSQICHIVTPTSSGAEIVDEQRHIAMPYYGRICPFETPAGKKLGMVNTKAIGARIKDNILYAPYYKVLSTADGIRISKKVTWMSVQDEVGKKFGDILSLQKDENGKYINNYILARLPNPDTSDEQFIFKNIRAFDLAGGYVSAQPEQFLSPTVALMPGCCADDAVRISFGASQMRQSVYHYASERTRVITPMYEKMVSCLDSVKYRAPYSGRIKRITTEQAVLVTDNGKEITIPICNDADAGKLDITIELYVKAGDRVSDGQKLAEVFSYPQTFVLRAPYSGKIIDITQDKVVIQKSENANPNFVDLENVDSVSFENGRIRGQSALFMNFHVSVGDFVKKGQLLADTVASRDGFYTPSCDVLTAYNCEGFNYEDGVIASESGSVKFTTLIAHRIEHAINKKNYPYSSTNLASGFKYCKAGDIIATVKQRKEVMDKDGFSKYIRATDKVSGIPFEITTLENDSKLRRILIHVLGFNKLQSGDKMSGRHGNKGVVSRVIPDSMAPQLVNGRVIDIINNPLGVPSRMNTGQILELHLGLIAHVLGIIIDSPSYNGASLDDTARLMSFAYDVANLPDSSRSSFDSVCSNYPDIPKEVYDMAWANIDEARDWAGVFDKEGNGDVYDPITDTFYTGKMTIGFVAYFKLMQEADEKMNVRSGPIEESYARITSQPQKNLESAKGQRVAEMELMALSALGASAIIDESLNEMSDNDGRRSNMHLKQLGLEPLLDDVSCYSRSVENLLYMLEGCGVHVDVTPDICDIGIRATRRKETLNLNYAIKEAFNYISNTNSMEDKSKIEDLDDMEE